jgi:hypothetical protein
MKFVSTILLAIGALMLIMGSQGMGPRDIEESAISLMVLAVALYVIWGRSTAK